jgi:putative transposase
LDEVFVKVNGKLCYLWRAVDHEGEVLEAVVTAKRDKAAALKFLKRIMKTYGRPQKIVTDGLCSYSAAMKEIGNADLREVGRRLNNRAENSHQPFRRRESAMQRFRSVKTLQKFSPVHAQVHNHFNQERHLVIRQVYKQRRLPHWPNGAPSLPNGRLGLGVLRQTKTTGRYYDKAVECPPLQSSRYRIHRQP